ncbi:MAG: UDP-N-acetylmuramate:L-alanyl-gamma-D-glutamyl-meso-diaminopimelate ligase [Proteobacteria bacterium]|nr:UDP-N-acetylmuramate:L-alanyl-gamma-D-glutamyl-meso-diaminopimelate ligase [Pseudomonadota bacterium]
MHIHILGVCGTFMGGLAAIANQAGYKVTGCDEGVYPPMSLQLQSIGIDLIEGWGVEQLDLNPDLYVVGNVVSRGNPLMEEILNRNLPYVSGPHWLYESVLASKWVLAVAGTHGKTTTTAMLAKILDYAGLNPGFLVGGVPIDFGTSSRMTESDFFVIEADEYDTAFFDKRSKFLHYRPRTAVFNNLEYDHADIFPNLDAIESQFHHFVRTVPSKGALIVNQDSPALSRVTERGCWSEVIPFGGPESWSYRKLNNGEQIEILYNGAIKGSYKPRFFGAHNLDNALAALLAARHSGVPIEVGLRALEDFRGVKRRMELRGKVSKIQVYDDFAHHPTAIKTTLEGLKQRYPDARVLAVFEPRSNSMKLGHHNAYLSDSLAIADFVYCYTRGLNWNADELFASMGDAVFLSDDVNVMARSIVANACPGDFILIMSNGGFQNIQEKVLDLLRSKSIK